MLDPGNKKLVWVPDKEEYFVVKYVEKEESTGVTCTDGSKYKLSEINNVNPEKFATVSNLEDLSYLNEPSVLDCLKNRLEIDQVYTNSGMFLIATNPYKLMEQMYSDETKRKIDSKRYFAPHIYKTAAHAYDLMVETGVNQSILITGESGAGKTVNTKKVIDYLSFSAGSISNNVNELLISANPILEAFGNAKTIKNENSSRFGKFIQIFFANKLICGGKIETYLLEVSRVSHVTDQERNYHIFHFLCAAPEELKQQLRIEGKTFKDFKNTRNASEVAHGIDDKQELENVIKCFKQFKIDYMEYFKCVAAIMHFSNLEFVQDGNCVKIVDMELIGVISELLNIDVTKLLDCIVNPIVTAGKEKIKVTRTPENCIKLVEAIMKNLYQKLFLQLVEAINKQFYSSTYDNFIGVLDIAGFEIFKTNTFEQLLINYTNEKLQQFFNTKMFEEEQKIYKTEGMEWDYIDFGLDLEPCIKVIEGNNPIGILSYLDEECVMPGANDDSVIRKILSIKTTAVKGGVSQGTVVKEIKGNREAFKLSHYAGDVEYTVKGWIEKNKHISSEAIDALIGAVSHSKKKGIFRTVAQGHREQLKQLMVMLNSTHPHFVRCLLPNLVKRPAIIDKKLVLDQLRCNGILEGLRIARLGYPTRIKFADLCNRYNYILDNEYANLKKIDLAVKILDKLKEKKYLQESDYKIGNTMVFFKQGVVAELENYRSDFLIKMAVSIQAIVRYKLAERKKNYESIRKNAIESLKQDIQTHIELQKTKWWSLYQKVKPLLEVRNKEIEVQETKKTIDNFKEQISKLTEENKYKDEDIQTLKNKIQEMTIKHEESNNDLMYKLTEAEELNQGLRGIVSEKEQCIINLSNETNDKENTINNLQMQLNSKKEEIEDLNSKLSSEKTRIFDLEAQKTDLENTIKQKENDCERIKKQLQTERNAASQSGEEIHKKFNKMIQEKEEEISKLQSNLEMITKKFNGLTKDYQVQGDEKDELENTLAKAKQRNEEISVELLGKENEIKSIKSNLEKQKKSYQDEINTMEKIIEKLRQENREGEKLTETLNSQISKLKNDEIHHLSELASAQEDINHLKAKYDNLNKNFDKILSEKENTKSTNAEDKALIDELTDKVEKYSEMIRKLKQDKENLYKENLELQEAKMQDLFKAETETKILKNNYQTQISKLKQENAQLREELNQSDDSVDARVIMEAKQQHMKRITELELKNFELEQKLQSFDLNEINKEVDEIKENVTNIVREFMTNFNNLMNKKHDIEAMQIKVIDEMNEKHHQEIDTLRKSYNDLFDKFKGINNKGTNVLELKITQLERVIEDQSKTIDAMSQAISFMKKKKSIRTSSSNLSRDDLEDL